MTKSLPFADKSSENIIVGKLGKVRGLKGEMKIIPLTDFEGRFDGLTEIFVDGKLMQISSVNHIGEETFIKFKEIDNRELAKTLTNKFLTVPRAQAAPLDEDEYYTFDIIGCEVFCGERKIGVVTDVLKTGSNDVFQVEGDKEILIPALKSAVAEINIADKKVFITEEWASAD